MGRWLQTYQTPEEILMTKLKTITTSLLAKYEAENPDFHYDFESFVKELLTDENETSVARVFDMLIRDVYKRTRRQSRASSQDPSSSSSPAGLPNVPVTGGPPDPARLARFLQTQQSQYSLLRSSSNPRQAPVSDGETPREAREHRLIREYPSRQGGRRRIDPAISVEEMMWPAEIRIVSDAVVPREEDKDEDAVVETMDVGLGTVVV